MVTRRARGFTYLAVLFIVAILMGGLALVGEVWETSARREKEAELLFIGHQYRRAIGLYHDSTPGGVKRYPRALEDLVKDPRQPATQRYLRRFYPDPITESAATWLLVQPEDPQKSGVYDVRSGAPGKGRDGSEFSQW